MEHSEKTSHSETVVNVSDADWQKKAETAEQRRRDTQSMLTPLQQDNIRLRAENEVLQTQSVGHPKVVLEPAEQTRLDDLKLSDPDIWHKELNTLEQTARTQAQAAYKSEVDAKVTEKITTEEKALRQKEVLKFFEDNKDVDMESFNNVIPVSLQNAMANNEITVKEFLDKGAEIVRGAPIASVIAPNSPDIGAVAGSASPSKEAIDKQKNTDWATALV